MSESKKEFVYSGSFWNKVKQSFRDKRAIKMYIVFILFVIFHMYKKELLLFLNNVF